MTTRDPGPKEALQQSEDKFRLLFDYVADALLLHDLQGRIVEVNQTACDSLGYTPEDLKQTDLAAVEVGISPESRADLWTRVVEGEKLTMLGLHRRRDGTTFPVEVHLGSFEYAGRPHILACARDISARLRVEEALRASESFMNSILDQSPYPMWISDHQGTLIKLNQACQDLVRLTAAELVGKYNIFNDNIVKEQGLFPLLHRVFQQGESVNFEITYDTARLEAVPIKTPTLVILDVTVSPIIDAQGRVTNAVFQHVDITGRKRVEEELRQEKLFTEVILDSLPGVFFLFDSQGRHLRTNKAGQLLSGYSEAELPGMHALDFIVEEDKPAAAQALAMVLEKGEATVEARQLTKDGRQLPFFFTARKFFIGDQPCILGTGVDISERQLAEKKLKESEERYRSLFQNHHAAMLLVDPDSGAIVDANPAACAYYGFSKAELLAKKTTDINTLPPEQVSQAMQKAKAEKRKHFTFQHRLAHGEIRDVEVYSGPIRVNGRELLYSIIHDVTARKRAEKALRRSENQFRRERALLQALIDSIPDLICFKDRDSVFLGCNKAFEAYSGMVAEELVGKTDLEIAPSEVAESYRQKDREMLASGQAQRNEEWIPFKDGGGSFFETLKTPFYGPEGELLGLIGVSRDITARKEAEEALRESERNYRSLFRDFQGVLNTIPDTLCLISPDLRIVWGNEAVARDIHQPSVSALLGKHCYPLRHDRDEACENCPVVRCFSSGRMETEEVFSHGNIWELRAFPIYDDQGELRGAIEVARKITERKRMEEALRESEARFRQVVEASPLPIGMATEKGRIEYINPKFVETFGYTLEDLQQLEDWYRLAYPDPAYREKVVSRWQAAMEKITREGGTSENLEVEITCKDGSKRIMEIFGALMGEQTLALFNDLTERKRMEERLRENEQKYRSLYLEFQAILNTIPDVLCLISPDLRIVWANEATAQALPASTLADIIGEHCYPLRHDFSEPCDFCPVIRCMASGRMETEEVFSHGGIWELRALPIYDDQGQVRGAIELARNITERKEAEAQLLEAQERLELALQGADLGTWDWNIETGAMSINPRWAEMLGYTVEEVDLHVRFWEKLVHPDELPVVTEILNAHLQGETPSYETEHRLRHKSGEWIWVLDKGKVIEWDAQGRALRACGTHLDITERKRAEEALRESEEQLRLALQAANQGLYDLNLQTGETKVTPEYATMLGYNPAEFQETRDHWLESLHPDDRQRVSETYRAYIRGDSPDYAVEFRLRTRSGDWKWILSLGKIVARDDKGKPVRMLGTHTDISKTKQMEESLVRTQFSVDRAMDAIHWVRPDGGLAYVNQAFCDSLGYTCEELLSMSIFDIDAKFPPENWWEHWLKAKELGSYKMETRHKTKDGRIIPVELAINYMNFGGDEFHCTFARDISERQRAEEALRNSERRLSEIIDFLPDATFAIDLEGKVIAWNRAIEEMTGVPAEDIVGKGNYEYTLPFYGIRRPALIDLVFMPDLEIEKKYAFVKKEGDILLAEAEVHVKGETKVVWAKARPLFDSEGHLVGAIEAIRDISERKRAEEERAKLESQMREVQKLESLGVLAGGIAHDFNNLLMAILGNADLALLSLSPASPARPNVEEIARASQRAADLCRQMLAYSGKGRFVVSRYDLSEIVKEMSQMLEVSVSKKATLRYSFGEKLPPVEADATQLRQVIMNLITNASEALEDQSGFISVSTGVMDCDRSYLASCYLDDGLPDGKYVFLEVADTGCGMDEETRRRIFDPFFTTKFMGRGLGLAAVLGIVRGHKGAIKVYSEPGQGTTFKLLLPAGAWQANDQVDSEAYAPLSLKAGTILLIDDDPHVRYVASQMLTRLGFEVLTAAHGPQGLELFRACSHEIDCVLLDLTMPEMGGDEVFRELRRLRGDVCVILSSGYNEQDVTQKFVGKGLAGFIQKPYTVVKLKEVLNRVLGSQKSP